MAAGAAPDTATSSSSSASLPPNQNDVFISFRGADIRTEFLSHLRTALLQKNIKVYTDVKISKGEEVWPALAKAIQESHLAVLIFSEDYTSSTWCLRELKLILDCRGKMKQEVIPVFYKVDPSHVRKQTGTYMTALSKHTPDFKHEVEEWKLCLKAAAGLAGWDSKNERDDSELVQKIVQDVWKKLRHRHSNTFEGIFGIKQVYHKLKYYLENSSTGVRKIGIWGMAGIGKTTLANVAFSDLYSGYEGSCFLPNVREQWEKHGKDCLREKLFCKLLEDVNLDIGSAKVGTSFAMSSLDLRRLRSKKVLIVLDDVSSLQIDYLIGQNIPLGAGTGVIITSRDRDELIGQVDYILQVTELDSAESLQLFSSKAFKKDHPKKGYEEVSEKLVSYAKGVPLALTVLGSAISSKSSSDQCETFLKKLQKVPDSRIQDVLKVSYDGLDEYQKKIFLDIACFWKGEDKKDLIMVLDHLYDIDFSESEINTLQDKSLITISYNNEVRMHDLIQKMGKEIVRKENIENPGSRSRLWNDDDICDVLRNKKQGTDAVESIIFNVSRCRHTNLSRGIFTTMPNIKYLKFYASSWSDGCNLALPLGLDSLPDRDLKFLHWHGYPSKSLPSSFNAENLVELYMPKSHVEKLWDGVQDLGQLKTINLSSCQNLTELPDLSQAIKLEIMNLSFCSSLIEISSWLENLNKLRSLNLESCINLERLPRNIHLLCLEEVNCKACSRLQEFSLTSERMVYLSLEGAAIEGLPTQIWSLNKLDTLIISSCTRFENLPNRPDREELPSFDDLWSLNKPNRDVPWNLSSLQDLYLNETNIESLPVSIKDILSLKGLTLKKCNRLRSIPELPPFISYFRATDCASLQIVASSKTEQRKYRQALYFYNCKNLDQSSRNNIIGDAQFRVQHTESLRAELEYYHLSASISICLPGKDIPDWFTYQTAGSSLVFKIPSNPRFLGFALCLVLGGFEVNYDDHEEINVECRCKWNSNYGECHRAIKFEENYVKYSEDIPPALNSDHVFIWYNLNFGIYTDGMEGREMLFDFYGPHDNLVRKCGICPLFAEGFNDQGDQIESAYEGDQVQSVHESQPSRSGTENLHEIVEMQEEAPTRKKVRILRL